jgi:hypothetical protein
MTHILCPARMEPLYLHKSPETNRDEPQTRDQLQLLGADVVGHHRAGQNAYRRGEDESKRGPQKNRQLGDVVSSSKEQRSQLCLITQLSNKDSRKNRDKQSHIYEFSYGQQIYPRILLHHLSHQPTKRFNLCARFTAPHDVAPLHVPGRQILQGATPVRT